MLAEAAVSTQRSPMATRDARRPLGWYDLFELLDVFRDFEVIRVGIGKVHQSVRPKTLNRHCSRRLPSSSIRTHVPRKSKRATGKEIGLTWRFSLH